MPTTGARAHPVLSGPVLVTSPAVPTLVGIDVVAPTDGLSGLVS